MRAEQRREEKRIIERVLRGLSSEDDAEVARTLRAIMRACGKLEHEVPLKDHERFLLDTVERLVFALRSRLDLPTRESVTRLH